MSKIDTERLREHFTSGKHFEIYGEGTLEAYAVLSAAPELLDEIERLREENAAMIEFIRMSDYACEVCVNQHTDHICPCPYPDFGRCDFKWRGERKDKS